MKNDAQKLNCIAKPTNNDIEKTAWLVNHFHFIHKIMER